MIGWNVHRTRPQPECLGVALPTFIHNGSFHYTTNEVYADGTVNCWGGLDLPLFRQKLQTGWVNPQPRVGKEISLFNLGGARVAEAQWTSTVDDLLRHADAALHRLNPRMENLLDLEGCDSEPMGKGKGRIAKVPMINRSPYRLATDGQRVAGWEFPAFARPDAGDGHTYELAHCFVYADALVEVGYGSPPVTLDALADRFATGRLANSVPDGSWLVFPNLGRCRIDRGFWYVDPAQRLLECRDQVNKLSGGLGAIEACRHAFDEYERHPADAALLERLRQAYEAVPEHLRMYCGDMDSKDWPIRRALYGESGEPEDPTA